MKRLLSVLHVVVVFLLLALVTTPADASGCHAVAIRKAVVVEKVVTPVVAVTPFTPFVAIGIPTYNAVYTPTVAVPAPVAPAAPVAGQDTQVLEAIKTLSGQVQELNRRLIRLEGQGGQQPPQAPMPPADPFNPPAKAQQQAPQAFLQQVQQRCASCHDASVAKAKGKGFVMTEGGRLAQLAPEKVGEVIDEVTSGRMPPRKPGIVPLAAEEKVAFVQAMIGGK